MKAKEFIKEYKQWVQVIIHDGNLKELEEFLERYAKNISVESEKTDAYIDVIDGVCNLWFFPSYGGELQCEDPRESPFYNIITKNEFWDRQDSKKCVITNERFSYSMKVDGKTIHFTGSSTAEYFADHYESLGYEVEINRVS